MNMTYGKKGFTLIEILIALGILVIMGTTALLIVNPGEYLKQSRDAKRIGDIKAIDDAIATAIASSPNTTLGTSTVVYISIPDTATNCPTLTPILPTLPAGWSYYCASAANYKKTNGTGWMPIDFDALSAKAPIVTLPTDPINDASKNLYYIYTGGVKYALSAMLESDKYLKQSAVADEGYDPMRTESGSDPKLLGIAEGVSGYWSFDEGSGTTVYEKSGNGINGTWSGAGVHYATGKTGQAGQFNGVNDLVMFGSKTVLPLGLTYTAFIKTTDARSSALPYASADPIIGDTYGSVWFGFGMNTGKLTYHYAPGGAWATPLQSGININDGAWHLVGVTHNAATGVVNLYIDGVVRATTTFTYSNVYTGYNAIGTTYGGNAFNGLIDDARIYNRVLSPSEMQAMYTATK